MTEPFFEFSDFNWAGIDKIEYKRSAGGNTTTFSDVTRQNLFTGGGEAAFDLRYFECAPEGYTTLEKHEHVHLVIILRGQGEVLVGNELFSVKPCDMLRIPSWNVHQLINASDEPFGFLCTVNGTRDKYQLLSPQEVAELKENKEISAAIRVPEGYFSRGYE